MKTVRESAHLVRLERFRFVNAYLVREDDGLTLVDTMVRGSQGGLLAAARELGAPIVRVVITHAHDDHNGSLDALAAELPGAEIVCSAREARLMAGDDSMDPGEKPKRPRTATADTVPTRTVVPGDRIGSLEVCDARGHTPGQIALLDTRDRALICADSFTTLNRGVGTTAGPYWRFPLPGFVTWDDAAQLETCRALRALEPSALAPGHGAVVRDPGAAMDAAIARSGKA